MKPMGIMILAIGFCLFAQVAPADWPVARRLTVMSGDSRTPAMAIDSSGDLHVVWAEDITPPNYEIYYKKGTDGGATWTTSQRLSVTPGGSQEEPAIAIDSSGNLYVVWYDSTPGNLEIYYKKSADGGTTWTADQRLTWTPCVSWSGPMGSGWPDFAIDSSGNLHIVWLDKPPQQCNSEFEIYYKKGK
jgi:hypothetical protein